MSLDVKPPRQGGGIEMTIIYLRLVVLLIAYAIVI